MLAVVFAAPKSLLSRLPMAASAGERARRSLATGLYLLESFPGAARCE